MALQHQIEEVAGSASWVPAASRFDNTTGGAVVSAVGVGLADDYELTFEDVDPGVSATVKINSGDYGLLNPDHDQTGKAVALDAATVHNNLIAGLGLVFSDDIAFDDTFESVVRSGLSHGAQVAFGSGVGAAGASRRHRVVNTGGVDAIACKARLAPIVKLRPQVGILFDSLSPFAADAVAKLTSGRVMPYAVTIDNFTPGSPNLADVLFDGAAAPATNVTEATDGDTLQCRAGDTYRITAGNLTGCEFVLSADADGSSTANILVFAPQFLEIAPDVAGVAGAWASGDGVSVVLTETGELAGVITPSGFAYFWTRARVGEGANAKSNPYPCNVELVEVVDGAEVITVAALSVSVSGGEGIKLVVDLLDARLASVR